MEKFSDSDFWRGIILYGLNAATYKIALGKILIELSDQGVEKVDWDLLSKSFFDSYYDRIASCFLEP